jgi:excisionase family DNA binding protein
VSSRDRLARILGPDLLELLGAFVGECVEVAIARREADRRWLSVSAAADHLGVTEKAVRRRIERGTVAYTRFGTRILIDRRALDVELGNRIRGNHPNG